VLATVCALALAGHAAAVQAQAAPEEEGAEEQMPAGEEAAGEEEGEGAPAEAPVAPLSPEQQARLQTAPGEVVEAPEPRTSRFVLPPYMYESGPHGFTRAFFPVYFQSRRDEDRRLLIGPYYRLRSPQVQGDVAFPLFFNFRGTSEGAAWSTTVVPPVWVHTRRGPDRAHAAYYGVAPLFSYGERFDRQGRLEAEHLVIPPLLTYHRWWPTGQTTIAGPFIYLRNGASVNWTVAPFVFAHSSPSVSWQVIPPLLFYRRVNHVENTAFTWAALYFGESGPGRASHNVAPLFFHSHDRTSSRTTLLPFFHTESGPNRFSLITPLGGYARTADDSTLVLPFYQRHRGGETNWDAVLPFFYYGRQPRTGRTTLVAGPVFSSTSPSGYSWGVLPFVARWHQFGRYDTIATPLFVHTDVEESGSRATWVFPSIHSVRTPDYRAFNIYPLVYTARGRDWHHNIYFPFVWDVGNSTTGKQVTVVAPFFARVSDRNSRTQWIFPNHFYWDAVRDGQRSFGWDFFPFVQYGEPAPNARYWSVLHGLIGHRRQGSFEQWRVFWIPFGGAAPTAAPAAGAQARTRVSQDVLLDL
jgi:hypothetical protein